MNYHFVWCPKYRRPVLVGAVRDRLEDLIREKVEQLGCKVIASLLAQTMFTHLFRLTLSFHLTP